ncbi:MAG: hypothetical protein JW782_06025 [Candidatus Saganbacteria bacterium]|nr:hypothetical protein [Candidatus Saganbacteria bacterium]
MKIKDSILVASAYLFGIPALYIVLTDLRKKEYIGFHGGQALLLWCCFFIIFFGQRALADPGQEWIEQTVLIVLGAYAVFCAYRSFIGVVFRIPK